MKRIHLLALSILAVFISSCSYTQYKQIPIEVYKPHTIQLAPQQNHSVAIISRNFKYDTDTMQNFYKVDGRLVRSKTNAYATDSMLTQSAIKELARELHKKPFREIKILPYSAFKLHTASKMPKLSPQLVKKITDEHKTDFLISLETFSYFYSRQSNDGYMPESRKVVTASIWALYDSRTHKIINRKSIIDTLYWNKYDQKGNYDRKKELPPRTKALQIAAQMAAQKYAKNYYDSWKSVNRLYALPEIAEFSVAAQHSKKGEWDKAISIWQEFSDERNGETAISANYNLALGYEIKDQIPYAIKHLLVAERLANKYNNKEDLQRIKTYVKVLNNRLRDISRLNQNQ